MRSQIAAFAALALPILPLAGCSTTPTIEQRRWTEETLFADVVATYTRPPGGLSGHAAINGDDLVAITKGIEFLKRTPDKWCSDFAIEDHYVFYKRSGTAVSITFTPAYVPDPENVSGVYPQADGTQRVIVARIDGARRLLGCAATIETSDNGLSFIRVDSFARTPDGK